MKMEKGNEAPTEKVKVDDVAAFFLRYYYNNLSQGPEAVLGSYSEDSSVKRFGGESVKGLQDIKAELGRHHHNNFKMRICKVNSEYSFSDSVLIQVGAQLYTDGNPKGCIQNFILVPRGPRQYYIHTDIMDWTDSLTPEVNSVNKPLLNGQGKPLREPPTTKPLVPNGVVPQSPAEPPKPATAVGTPLKNGIAAASAAAQPSPQKPKTPVKAEAAPQQQAPVPKPGPPQPPAPRTWANLVSGEIKSNGLPPPTQPIPHVEPPAAKPVPRNAPQNNKENRPHQQGERPERLQLERKPNRLFFSYLRRKAGSETPQVEAAVRTAFEFLGEIQQVHLSCLERWISGCVDFKEESSVKLAFEKADSNTGKPGLQLRVNIPDWQELIQIGDTRYNNSNRNRDGVRERRDNAGNGGWTSGRHHGPPGRHPRSQQPPPQHAAQAR